MARRTAAVLLAERFCRPHRVGLFGHRGVGKTTLLTVLYREAVAGRLSDLRLAAADVPTANYLSDKITQLESGQPLPATLAETDLQFHLYHQQARIELLMRDYQGEHVELGRDGSIQQFLRDCDAVWLCLDLGAMPAAEARLRRQQEIESLMEDYLKCEDRPTLERPIALVLTKADLLATLPDNFDALAQQHFGMTRHALASHCPQNGVFAVSSHTALNREQSTGGDASPPPADSPLATVLFWLAKSLQSLDESRLERLWSLAPNDSRLLHRCVNVFAKRYPDAPVTQTYRQRLLELKRRKRRRLTLAAVVVLACLALGTWSYDAVGQEQAERFAATHDTDPGAVLDNWKTFETWHPTRLLWGQVNAEQEELRRLELLHRIRDQQRDQRLAALRRDAADPDADPSAAWQRFIDFRTAHSEVNIEGDLEQLRSVMKGRRDEQFAAQARQALDELLRAAQRSDNLAAVVKQADRFLVDFAGTPSESEGRLCRDAILARLDEQDIRTARAYSARYPLNFQTRREHYQAYLDKHPTGGAFSGEAGDALRTIEAEWDKHDFRTIRDHYLKEPNNVSALASHCRRYLAVHPTGKFKTSATELLRWTERVSTPGEYKVTLRSGHFDSSISRWFTRGPKLSVELEVGGVRYGPSTICYNSNDPQWDFEFPRRIRWKHGDSVIIRVTDHNWSNKEVMEVASDPGDALGMKLLTGAVSSGAHFVTFGSDFAMPVLPKVE
jgi:hypothetical protein